MDFVHHTHTHNHAYWDWPWLLHTDFGSNDHAVDTDWNIGNGNVTARRYRVEIKFVFIEKNK